MNVGIVIAARMQSSRLPGKVLLPTPTGESLLAVMLERVKRAGISPIIVATTWDAADTAIVHEAERCGVKWWHGPTDDVLARIVQTADAYHLDTVVRVTSDCPLISPEVIAYCVATFGKYDYDYVGTSDRFPDGMDVDVLSTAVLRRSLASPLKSDHEHVTLWAEREARCLMIEPEELGLPESGHIRVTLDYKEDYTVINGLLKLGSNAITIGEVIRAYEMLPDLWKGTEQYVRNMGLAKSLAAEATA